MRFDVVTAVLAALALAVDASPTGRSHTKRSLAKRSVLHETRPVAAAHTWKKTTKLHHEAVLPVRIGLTQQNLHRADEFINDVSHPASPNYGRHWTQDQIANMFAPSQEAIDAVRQWITDELGDKVIRLSRGRNWLSFNATVRELESLLETEYHIYKHTDHGAHHVACDQYHVPAHLREHIDLVTPTVHFDGRLGASRGATKKTEALPDELQDVLMKRAATQHEERAAHAAKGIMGGPSDASLTKQGKVITNALMSLDQCDTMITPACLRALYKTPVGSLAASNNSLGVVEYTPQAILQTDLDLYFSQFNTKLQGTSPVIKLLDNAVVQTTDQGFTYNGESALDLEFAMALVYPQTTTLFQVGDLEQGGSFNNLLDVLDGSYCTADGGDSTDSTIDGQYDSSINCGTATPTNVISTSYSYNEGDLTAAYEQRQCLEYMKLGLQGVTIVYSSGDFGVAGNSDTCIDDATGAYNDGTTGRFNPSFPGTCPYITSVGATELANGTSVRGDEVACEKVIYSGGGFSNVFAMPSYQSKALAAYFADTPPPYNATQFNNSQIVRGYPDVAANGANYVTAVNGNFTLSYGTSASAPTFASIVNLINEKRIQAGKAPVGFINPVLYANPHVMNDITSGTNPGCGTTGFEAVAGWDPLTGLGTPNYKKMVKLFMSLQ